MNRLILSVVIVLLFLFIVMGSIVTAVANDVVFGGVSYLPSAARRLERWKARADVDLAELDKRFTLWQRTYPYAPEYERKRAEILAASGSEHWLTSPVAHASECIRAYSSAAATEGFLWGGIAGAAVAVGVVFVCRGAARPGFQGSGPEDPSTGTSGP